MSSGGPWLVGVDGCKGGWISAWVQPNEPSVEVKIFSRFMEILNASPAIVAVDMPIGLPKRAGPGGRAAENAIRPLLGERQSSVFSVPSRAAVYATNYGSACATALATSEPPRKVSKQLFMLAPKIREVDACLRMDTQVAACVFEVHPELAFWRLNGERALSEPKKVKSRPHSPGLDQRRALLMAAGVPEAIAQMSPPRGTGPDDLLDALACAMIARRIHAGIATPFPNPPPRDEFGLPMAIWA